MAIKHYDVTCTKIFNGNLFVKAESAEEAIRLAQERLGDVVWDFGEETADCADEVVLKKHDRVYWRDPQRYNEGLPEDERVWIIQELREDMVFLITGEPGKPGYSEAEVPLSEIEIY